MARAMAAHAATLIRAHIGSAFRMPGLPGHVRLLASPAYRHFLQAEPILRRSIPVLIITFIAVLALTRAVGILEEYQSLEDNARDETALIATAVAASLTRAETHLPEVGYQAALRTVLADSIPPRAPADGRLILVTDPTGTVVASAPAGSMWDNRPITDLLGLAQPLTTFGARAGVMEIRLTDGALAYAMVQHLEGKLGSVAVVHREKAIFAEWRRNVHANITMFVFTAVILLLLTYAYFAQASRASAADLLYADTTARAETAFKRGRCGFWDWDLARGKFFWSSSMHEMLGLGLDGGIIGFGEVVGLTNKDDVDLVQLANQLARGEIATLDRAFRMKRADGQWLWFRVRAEVVDRPETGSRHLVGIAADITEHKHLAERTATADLRLRDAIETISEAFVLWDADNRLVMCNSKYLELHGLPQQASHAGTPYHDLMRNARQPLVHTPIPAEDGEVDGARTYEAQIEDGRWLQINERRTKDGGFVSVGTDITQLKRHEEKLLDSEKRLMGTVMDLRQSRQKLEVQAQQLVELAEKYAEEKSRAEEANRIKSDFLANISHELRTPLNAIIGFSEIMSRGVIGTLGPEKYIEYARDIHTSGNFLLNVINDILDMSKIESGRLEIASEPVELDGILTETTRLIAQQAEEKHLALHADVAPGLSFVGDRRAIKQVLLNLVSNAVKFTPAGGKVTIRARAVSDAVTISIEDTGIGIPKEHIASLGQPFVQVENQFTKTHKGSGLGLAIARSLVELHGGAMKIFSTPGVGTIVSVRLPRSTPKGDRQVA